MADNQTLAAVQEVLLNARIAHTSGTEAQWTTANPVLLKGEIGLVDGTSPAKFKVGDGVKKWSELAWGSVTTLAQLAADATHRLVTDAQITAWNGKAEKTTATTSNNGLMSAADKTKLNGIASGANNYVHPAAHPATMITEDATHRFATDTEKAKWNAKARVITLYWDAYNNSDSAVSNPQKEIVKDIVRSVNAGENVIVLAMNVKPETNYREPVSGYVTFGSKSSSQVRGIVEDFSYDSNNGGGSIYLFSASLIFKSDGTIVTETNQLTPELVTEEGLPEYSTEKAPTVSGFAATYYLTKGGQRIGVPINIPLDQVLKSSSIKTVTTTGTPYTGAKVGDKYIEFVFQNNSTPQYLPVQDLVDVYKGDNTYIQVSSTNVISLNYSALKTKLQNDLGSVFDAKGAGTAAAKAAIEEFKNSSFVIKCAIPGMS